MKEQHKQSELPTDPQSIAEELLLECIFVPNSEAGVILANRAGADYKLRFWQAGWFLWQNGAFQALTDTSVRLLVTKFLHERNESEERLKIRVSGINDILLNLAAFVYLPDERLLNSWPTGDENYGKQTLCAGNGLIVYKNDGTAKLLDHTPRYFSTVKLNYDYDAEAKCPLWTAFLKEVMLGDAEYVALLQEFCGYIFRPDLREQKFLLFTGEGSNGKGVVFDVLAGLYGKPNCSDSSLVRFNQPFALYSTLGKLVNMASESSHIIEHEAENVLKGYVAGDTLMFERKFKDPVFAVPTAKIIIATNSKPRFNDKTYGMWRRILLVPFDKVITEANQIKNLADELKTELPGILNWALAGLARLNNQGGFTAPHRAGPLLEDYRRESDPARAFLMENYEASGNGEAVACAELYRNYRQWCDAEGCKAMGSRSLGKQVSRLYTAVERKRVRFLGEREWRYAGLTPILSL